MGCHYNSESRMWSLTVGYGPDNSQENPKAEPEVRVRF